MSSTILDSVEARSIRGPAGKWIQIVDPRIRIGFPKHRQFHNKVSPLHDATLATRRPETAPRRAGT